jgi:hypothetical protein
MRPLNRMRAVPKEPRARPNDTGVASTLLTRLERQGMVAIRRRGKRDGVDTDRARAAVLQDLARAYMPDRLTARDSGCCLRPVRRRTCCNGTHLPSGIGSSPRPTKECRHS